MISFSTAERFSATYHINYAHMITLSKKTAKENIDTRR
jgi:hypothetical protein